MLVLCFALECSSAFRARGTPRRVARESERAIRFQIVVLSCMLANEISPMRTANPDARAAPNGQDVPGHLLHFPPPDDSRAHRTITSLAVTLILTLFASLDSSWYDSTSTPRSQGGHPYKLGSCQSPQRQRSTLCTMLLAYFSRPRLHRSIHLCSQRAPKRPYREAMLRATEPAVVEAHLYSLTNTMLGSSVRSHSPATSSPEPVSRPSGSKVNGATSSMAKQLSWPARLSVRYAGVGRSLPALIRSGGASWKQPTMCNVAKTA